VVAARHEAGHALLAYLGDVAIESVRVTDTGTGKVSPVAEVADAPEAWLLVAIAGNVAQPSKLDGAAPRVDSEDGKLAYAAGLKIGRTSFNDVEAARQGVMDTLADHCCHHTLLAEYLCIRHNTTIPWADVESQLKKIFKTCADD
jgi:hypothetical protein